MLLGQSNRAYEMIKEFLECQLSGPAFDKKIKAFYEKIVFIQRFWHYKFYKSRHDQWYGKVFAKELPTARVLYANTALL